MKKKAENDLGPCWDCGWYVEEGLEGTGIGNRGPGSLIL